MFLLKKWMLQVTVINSSGFQCQYLDDAEVAESESISTAISAKEEVGPDLDDEGASSDQVQGSQDGVWDIPWDPWATRGAGMILFCPKH